MGLKRKKHIKKHSILKMESIYSFDDYLSRLNSRSVSTTFRSQIDRVFAKDSISTKTSSRCSFEQFLVILGHERQVYKNNTKAVLVSLVRFLCVVCMVGSFDEYYHDGKLIAFSSTIVKGNTLRAMWFYQLPEFNHCQIWFHSVRSSVRRAILMKLSSIDLGPSTSENLSDLKSKFGFEYCDSWLQLYDGPFRYDIPEVSCETMSAQSKQDPKDKEQKKKNFFISFFI